MGRKLTEDKIRLDKALIREKEKRDIHVKWVAEMFKRRNEKSCPRCSYSKWLQRGSGFSLSWMCDECGLVVTKKDLYKAQIYFDFIKVHTKKELERIERAERASQSVRNYRKDKI